MDSEKTALNAQETQVRLAAERNLLAWVRTGLSMMGFGFVVAKFGLFMRALVEAAKVNTPIQHGISSWIGTGLVLLGILACVLAAVQHYRFLARMRRGDDYPAPRWSLGIAMALLLAILGGGIVVYLMSVAF